MRKCPEAKQCVSESVLIHTVPEKVFELAAMAIAAACPASSTAFGFCDGQLALRGEHVPLLYYADINEVRIRAKQIHTFTGATTMAQTLQRVDGEDKCCLTELVRRKGLPPRGGMLNIPPADPEDHNEGKAIYS
jgi:hypothetical protein